MHHTFQGQGQGLFQTDHRQPEYVCGDRGTYAVRGNGQILVRDIQILGQLHGLGAHHAQTAQGRT